MHNSPHSSWSLRTRSCQQSRGSTQQHSDNKQQCIAKSFHPQISISCRMKSGEKAWMRFTHDACCVCHRVFLYIAGWRLREFHLLLPAITLKTFESCQWSGQLVLRHITVGVIEQLPQMNVESWLVPRCLCMCRSYMSWHVSCKNQSRISPLIFHSAENKHQGVERIGTRL